MTPDAERDWIAERDAAVARQQLLEGLLAAERAEVERLRAAEGMEITRRMVEEVAEAIVRDCRGLMRLQRDVPEGPLGDAMVIAGTAVHAVHKHLAAALSEERES